MYHTMIHKCCNRCANALASNRRRLEVRAGACPVAGANAPALAPRHLITIHMYHKKHTHVANAVPLHQLAIGRD